MKTQKTKPEDCVPEDVFTSHVQLLLFDCKFIITKSKLIQTQTRVLQNDFCFFSSFGDWISCNRL